MDSVEAFLTAPSEEVLDSLTKDQLREVVAHYTFDRYLAKGLEKLGEAPGVSRIPSIC